MIDFTLRGGPYDGFEAVIQTSPGESYSVIKMHEEFYRMCGYLPENDGPHVVGLTLVFQWIPASSLENGTPFFHLNALPITPCDEQSHPEDDSIEYDD